VEMFQLKALTSNPSGREQMALHRRSWKKGLKPERTVRLLTAAQLEEGTCQRWYSLVERARWGAAVRSSTEVSKTSGPLDCARQLHGEEKGGQFFPPTLRRA